MIPANENIHTTETICEPLWSAQPTAADFGQARHIVSCLRRLNTLGLNAGKSLCRTVTVGDLADTMKLSPERIVWLIRSACYWQVVEEIEGRPIREWWVWEDGE